MKHTSLVFIIAAGISTNALADDRIGGYVGADVGQTKMKLDDSGAGSTSANVTEWQIFGGYKINEYVAAEMSYRDFGKKNYNTTIGMLSLKANAVQLAVKGIIPINDVFSIYGKAGGAYIHGDASGTVNSVAVSGSQNKTKPFGGIGAEFFLTRDMGIMAEWDYYANYDLGNSGVTVKLSVLSLGFEYLF